VTKKKQKIAANFTVWNKVPRGGSLILGDNRIPVYQNVTSGSLCTENQLD